MGRNGQALSPHLRCGLSLAPVTEMRQRGCEQLEAVEGESWVLPGLPGASAEARTGSRQLL